jgi:hypothetical protein
MSFTGEILAEMLGVVGAMVLRSHIYLQQIMREQDEVCHNRCRWTESRELDEILPKVMDLQRHFAELAQINASTQRLAELARQRQLENAKPPKQAPKAAPRKRKPAKRFTSKRKASSGAGNRMT